MPPEPLVYSKDNIQNWMIMYLANLLMIAPDDVDPTVTFDSYGLDSSAAIGMTGDLEDWLKHQVDPTVLYDYPAIHALATHLADVMNS
ncbi:MAG: acyl carrier protein [Leptolyngbya sp. SIO3F4]|nr:acyl carrier protein [Leptolyngbya sp. SIO3F4]